VLEKEFYAVPIFGLCLKYEKHIKLDRENCRKGVESIQKAGDPISQEKSLLVRKAVCLLLQLQNFSSASND